MKPMTDAPERIWIGVGMPGWIDNGPDELWPTEYIRGDLPAAPAVDREAIMDIVRGCMDPDTSAADWHDLNTAVDDILSTINVTPAEVTVKPLQWRDSYGVTRADTDIGTWYLKGKIAEFSKQRFSMVVGDDPKADVQAKHEKMLSGLVNVTSVEGEG